MSRLKPGDCLNYNVGIGKGYSVREIIDAVKRVTGREFAVRQSSLGVPATPPAVFDNPAKIQHKLGWHTRRSPTSTESSIPRGMGQVAPQWISQIVSRSEDACLVA